MRRTLPLVGCVFLTLLVAHTCLRIEILNARSGYILPRIYRGFGNPKWRSAARSTAMRGVQGEIAFQRLDAYVAAHPDEPEPDVDQFLGPPFNEREQAQIVDAIEKNELNSELKDLVGSFGCLQYVLAPAAFVWSVFLSALSNRWLFRVLFGVCAVGNAFSIWVMFDRAYFTSLGW